MTVTVSPMARVGVVGTGFDVATGDDVTASRQGWMFDTANGFIHHGMAEEDRLGYSNSGKMSCDWPGQPKLSEIKPGDTIGLMLDMDRHTMAVYHNSTRLLAMQYGMMHEYGIPCASLEEPLRWAVQSDCGSSIRIDGSKPPPAVSEAERAEDETRWEADDRSRRGSDGLLYVYGRMGVMKLSRAHMKTTPRRSSPQGSPMGITKGSCLRAAGMQEAKQLMCEEQP